MGMLLRTLGLGLLISVLSIGIGGLFGWFFATTMLSFGGVSRFSIVTGLIAGAVIFLMALRLMSLRKYAESLLMGLLSLVVLGGVIGNVSDPQAVYALAAAVALIMIWDGLMIAWHTLRTKRALGGT